MAIVGSGLAMERTLEQIYTDGCDSIAVIGKPIGKTMLTTGEREAELFGEDIALVDLARPFSLRSDGQVGFGITVLKIPRSLLNKWVGIDQSNFDGKAIYDPSLGIVVKEIFNVISRECLSSEFVGFSKLINAFLDLAALALVNANLSNGFDRHDSHAGLRLAIQRYIDANLKNPELNHDMISRQFSISVRQVHKVVEGKGLTVGQYILNRRLQGAASQLKAIDHAHRKIGDIAFDWCFNELSHFSRAFKTHFGCTAREWRHQSRHH
ncbi:MAG: helix-turn-helix domain-containing protein [Hyphomicrobiales bacterium]